MDLEQFINSSNNLLAKHSSNYCNSNGKLRGNVVAWLTTPRLRYAKLVNLVTFSRKLKKLREQKCTTQCQCTTHGGFRTNDCYESFEYYSAFASSINEILIQSGDVVLPLEHLA